MRSQVDIGTLLLGLDDLGRPRALGRRVHQTHTDMAGQKVPQDDVKMWDCTQGTEIDLLSRRLVWVIRASAHLRGEIFDTVNRMMLSKQKAAERIKIEPFIWRIFHCAVVEIRVVPQ